MEGDHNFERTLSGLICAATPVDKTDLPIGRVTQVLFGVLERELGVSRSELRHKSRKRAYVDARTFFYVVLIAAKRPSCRAAGGYTKRDHSTVMHALRTHLLLKATLRSYRATFEKVLAACVEEIAQLEGKMQYKKSA